MTTSPSTRTTLRPGTYGETVRLLNQIHGTGTDRIRERFPEVEVVEVPYDGDVDPAVEGDALVAIPFAPSVTTLAPRVQWLHSFGTGGGGLAEEAFSVAGLTCSRGGGGVPIWAVVVATTLALWS